MRRFVLLIFIAVACGAAAQRAAAQPAKRKPAPKAAPAKSATAPESWPLASLEVTGNKLYTAAQIVAASGLKIGQTVSKEQFDAARERLTKTGVFESVGYQYGPAPGGSGYKGTFEVVEVEQLYPVRFEDLPATEQQIREYLKSREPLFSGKIPGTKEVVQRFTAELQEFAATKNFTEKITGAVVATEKPGELAVLFRPATHVPVVAEVTFAGNQVIPRSQLGNTLAAVAVGVAYREATMRQLLDANLRPLYEARGRMRVAFPKLTTQKAADVDGLRVNITVDEGPEFAFGDVRATAGVVNSTELLRLAALKKGDPANFEMVNAAIDRIQQRLRIGGYMHAKTRAERNIHDQQKTVDVSFISEPGPQFKMGKLTVEGLDVITEPVIRKLWTIKEGNPYNADYPANFLANVKEEGYFENLRSTKFDQRINEDTKTVDITLSFKGGADPEEPKRRRRQPPQ
jgi:outer membrane protein insertion porin family